MKWIVSKLGKIYLFFLRSERISAYVFRLNVFFGFTKRQEILILATITKTGTHYIRFLLSYYLLIYSKKNINHKDEVISDSHIVDRYFPNSWHTSYRYIKKKISPSEKLNILGLYDVPRSHMELKKKEWKGFKVLHTYRPTMDQTVVSWETKYKCDTSKDKEYKSAWDLFLDTYRENLKQEESFKDTTPDGINHLRISFDQIFHSPEDVLALIIMWLGYEPDLKICKMAAKLSQNTPSILIGGGEKWHRTPSKHVDQKILDKFISKNVENGAINVYREYFTKDEINKAKSLLNRK
jgi:hypothetical protein